MTSKYVSGPPWFSSYEKNNYGDLFYSIIRVYRPKTVIELGTKAGYSAYHIARALNDNGQGKLFCYDLWEKYPFHSVPKSVAQNNLKKFKNIIKFKLIEATKVSSLHKSVDILHIDISNEGGILNKIIPDWIKQTRQLIIIEGGSAERDKIEWMLKYKKVPIEKWLKDFGRRHKIEYVTVEPFPSVTLIRP